MASNIYQRENRTRRCNESGNDGRDDGLAPEKMFATKHVMIPKTMEMLLLGLAMSRGGRFSSHAVVRWTRWRQDTGSPCPRNFFEEALNHVSYQKA
jgi:hypothetical protein